MGKFKEFLANELIDQILEAAIAFIAVGFGVNYFFLSNYWVDATGLIASKAGLAATSNGEVNQMIATISNTFPFNYISMTNMTHVFIAGITMIVIGLFIKVLTTESRSELIKDIGKILVIPGIIGVVSLMLIQLMTANSINSLFNEATLRMTENIVTRVSPGIIVWNLMGILFLLGVFLLFFGYITTYTIQRIGGKPAALYVIGEAMVILGWFGLVFYLFFRILAIEQLARFLYGSQSLKLFTLMWYVSRSGFIMSICLFAFGLALYKYGKKLEGTNFGMQRPYLAYTVKNTVGGSKPVKHSSFESGSTIRKGMGITTEGDGRIKLTLPSERSGDNWRFR